MHQTLLKKMKLKTISVSAFSLDLFTSNYTDFHLFLLFFSFHQYNNGLGRKIAIDASMCLYQFLIAVRAEGAQLTSVDGETTSHLMGMFYRTIRMLENGIKPAYVFDGKPPELKSGELSKRQEKREEAQKALEKATEDGDAADMDKFNRRLVRVTKQHNAEAKELLKLMGVPYIEAPSEAEATVSLKSFNLFNFTFEKKKIIHVLVSQ